MFRSRLSFLVFSAIVLVNAPAFCDLSNERIELVIEWAVPEDIGSSPHNFDNIYSYIYTYNEYTYAVFTDKNHCPRVAKIKDGEAEIGIVENGYKALADGHNTFSLGIDKDGYIHIAGDMHHHPMDGNDHLDEPFRSASCLYWKSDNPEDVSSFTFLGNDASRVIPGAGFTYLNFFNDKDGDLYAISRQWVRNDHHWTYNSGKIALGMARYSENDQEWTALGDEAPIFTEHHPRAVTHMWEPNHNKVIFWEHTGVDSTCYQTWGNDVFIDDDNRMHLATGMNTDFSSNGSHPGAGTAICYAYSDDKGETWHKADGSLIESLPMRASTTDLVAGGHWYVMEAGVTVSPNRKPLVSYRYTTDGTGGNSTSRWREYGDNGWKDEVVLPEMYRRTKPRVDRKGVITVTEYDDVYRTTDYAVEGVETEMSNELFAFDKGYLESEGAFRMTAKVRVGNKDQFGIVRLDITPDAVVGARKSPGVSRSLYKNPAHAVVHYDFRGRIIDVGKAPDGLKRNAVCVVKDSEGNVAKRLLMK